MVDKDKAAPDVRSTGQADQPLKPVYESLRKRGHRITAQREVILQIFRDQLPGTHLSAEELYERTRGIWKVDPFKHPNVKYAMPVSTGGVIREVYRILRWVEVDTMSTDESPLRRKGVDTPSKTRYRWMFDGEVDKPMRERYVGRRVPGIAVQSPVLWRGPNDTDGMGPPIVKLERIKLLS